MHQRLMDIVLSGCSSFGKVYIDDILVASENWEEHVRHLREVLGCLQKAGLTAKRKKCEFGKRRLMFLGHVIGDGGLSVPEARVAGIRHIERPKTRKQLKSFIGVVNYYRRFISNFHEWSHLLTPSTSKNALVRVEWTDQMEEAFSVLKAKLCSDVLCVPTCEDCFILETDASGSGVGGVLSVERNGESRVVAFYSKQLQGAEHRYSAQELEDLALYKAIKHFAFYLFGRKFKVVTDHKPLVNLMKNPQHNRRVLNWAMKLADYSFDVEYREVSENLVADYLSRGWDFGD